MTNQPLSPAAQAILDAYGDFEPADVDAMAAALRAAADSINHATSAHTLHAIADELEGVKYGTYRCDLEGNESIHLYHQQWRPPGPYLLD